jgi:DsbC/DsbD-like thiol-disulfide interchange protein
LSLLAAVAFFIHKILKIMMSAIRIFCFSLFILAYSASAVSAQQESPVKWTFVAAKTKKKDHYTVTAVATVSSGWSIYSQFIEDSGPVPTAFTYELPTGAELSGKTEEVGDKIEGMDPIFEINLIKYKKTVRFVQTVKAKKGQKIKGQVTFMVCNDESCLPPRDVPFEVTIK